MNPQKITKKNKYNYLVLWGHMTQLTLRLEGVSEALVGGRHGRGVFLDGTALSSPTPQVISARHVGSKLSGCSIPAFPPSWATPGSQCSGLQHGQCVLLGPHKLCSSPLGHCWVSLAQVVFMVMSVSSTDLLNTSFAAFSFIFSMYQSHADKSNNNPTLLFSTPQWLGASYRYFIFVSLTLYHFQKSY